MTVRLVPSGGAAVQPPPDEAVVVPEAIKQLKRCTSHPILNQYRFLGTEWVRHLPCSQHRLQPLVLRSY